tara:strand:+ start:212 stop:529 length:318 start_codon:yes stop_codon:yes gene_type:complete
MAGTRRKTTSASKTKPQLTRRKPGGRDPIQHANSLYRTWLVTEDPVEKKLVKKELNTMMKTYDLVNPIKFNNQTKQGTTHYIFSRSDWERKKKLKQKSTSAQRRK